MPAVLLVAPTIDAGDVGEAWVAFQWASRLSEVHDLTVLTYAKRGSLAVGPQLPGAKVVEWREPPLLGRAERLNSLLKPGYGLFFTRARRWLREAQSRGERFEVAHQVAPIAMRYPSPLVGSGIPYVIGPVGGSLLSPPGFRDEEGSAPWYSRLRLIDGWRLRHDPFLRRTYEDAAVVLGIAPYVADALSHLNLKRLEILSETGVDELPPDIDRSGRRGTVRLLHVGRLVRTKAARDTIAAMGQLRDLPVRLDVIGDGPDREECEALVDRLDLRERVTFHGRLPRATIDDFYRSADVFVFPSYREPGGNVQYEAMAHGLPLIVADRGGPAAAVDETCALFIHPLHPEQYATEVARAVRRFAIDPALRLQMGRAARRRAEETGLWSAKVDTVGRLYDEVRRQ